MGSVISNGRNELLFIGITLTKGSSHLLHSTMVPPLALLHTRGRSGLGQLGRQSSESKNSHG